MSLDFFPPGTGELTKLTFENIFVVGGIDVSEKTPLFSEGSKTNVTLEGHS